MIGALQQSQREEEYSGREMNGVIACVEFDDPRDELQHGVVPNEQAADGNYRITKSETETEGAAYCGPRA